MHVVPTETGLELWLGEVKFYTSIAKAIADVVTELQTHTTVDYLRCEFIAISNKVDPRWPHASTLTKLLDKNTSLNDVFEAACIPVLLTYDSSIPAKHRKTSDAYKEEIVKELRSHHATFCGSALPDDIRIHLFLMPLSTKALLTSTLDKKLKAWQQI